MTTTKTTAASQGPRIRRRRRHRRVLAVVTGIAVPFYEGHLHADTLPMFRAMNAALAARAAR